MKSAHSLLSTNLELKEPSKLSSEMSAVIMVCNFEGSVIRLPCNHLGCYTQIRSLLSIPLRRGRRYNVRHYWGPSVPFSHSERTWQHSKQNNHVTFDKFSTTSTHFQRWKSDHFWQFNKNSFAKYFGRGTFIMWMKIVNT